MTCAPMPDRGLIKSHCPHGASRLPDGEEGNPDQHRQHEPGHQSRQLLHAVHPPDGAPPERLDCRPEREKAVLLEALEQAKEPTLPELLFQYLELRSGERADWTSRGKLKGTVADYNKVQAAMDFLRKKGISTAESLDTRLDEISKVPFPPWEA